MQNTPCSHQQSAVVLSSVLSPIHLQQRQRREVRRKKHAATPSYLRSRQQKADTELQERVCRCATTTKLTDSTESSHPCWQCPKNVWTCARNRRYWLALGYRSSRNHGRLIKNVFLSIALRRVATAVYKASGAVSTVFFYSYVALCVHNVAKQESPEELSWRDALQSSSLAIYYTNVRSGETLTSLANLLHRYHSASTCATQSLMKYKEAPSFW